MIVAKTSRRKRIISTRENGKAVSWIDDCRIPFERRVVRTPQQRLMNYSVKKSKQDVV